MKYASLVGVALVAVAAGAAMAGTTCWQSDPTIPGNWSWPHNWTDGVPERDDVAHINNGGTAMINDGSAVALRLHVGISRSGAVTQGAGAADFTQGLYLGGDIGSHGAYAIGGGSLAAGVIDVGHRYGSAEFRQLGGVAKTHALRFGHLPWWPATEVAPPSSVFDLAGGEFYADTVEIGPAGRGGFFQSGGRLTVHDALRIGGPMPWPPIDVAVLADAVSPDVILPPQPVFQGRYTLTGGLVTARQEHVGPTGVMMQTDGANTVNFLSVTRGGRYNYHGGRLTIVDGCDLAGVLDFGGSRTTLAAKQGLLNFACGQLARTENAALIGGRDSLMIFARGFDPKKAFARFDTSGLVHWAGRDLYIPRGRGFTGWGRIDDHVAAYGYMMASEGGGIDLAQGLYVGGGKVDLGNGHVTVVNRRSGTSAGLLRGLSMTITGPRADIVPIETADALSATVRPLTGSLFRQTGGTVVLDDRLTIACGMYNLQRGALSVGETVVGGRFPAGTRAAFVQTGGEARMDVLRIGRFIPWEILGEANIDAAETLSMYLPATRTIRPGPWTAPVGGSMYRIAGGRLAVRRLDLVGERDWARVVQTGGTVAVGDALQIGGRASTYSLYAGRLTTPVLRIGCPCNLSGRPTLAIRSPRAEVRVSRRLEFGRNSRLVAVPGAAIHMTGMTSPSGLMTTVENVSTDPHALAGLNNLSLIFETGGNLRSTLEVGGEDLGFSGAGFIENFALDTLQVGGEAVAAYLLLVDRFDNQPDWIGDEALYVTNLIITSGSYLNTGGLNIYYKHGQFPDDGTGGLILGGGAGEGGPSPLPEPVTIGLLAVGAAVMLYRRARAA